MTNTLSPGDKVLIARYGMFSSIVGSICVSAIGSMSKSSSASGARAHRPIVLPNGWRTTRRVRSRRCSSLTTRPRPVCAATSAPWRNAIDSTGHPALLMADCVSSLASMDFRMDEWGVDIAVARFAEGLHAVHRPCHRRRQRQGARMHARRDQHPLLLRLPDDEGGKRQGWVPVHTRRPSIERPAGKSGHAARGRVGQRVRTASPDGGRGASCSGGLGPGSVCANAPS